MNLHKMLEPNKPGTKNSATFFINGGIAHAFIGELEMTACLVLEVIYWFG